MPDEVSLPPVDVAPGLGVVTGDPAYLARLAERLAIAARLPASVAAMHVAAVAVSARPKLSDSFGSRGQ
jgi:hypothetical protein